MASKKKLKRRIAEQENQLKMNNRRIARLEHRVTTLESQVGWKWTNPGDPYRVTFKDVEAAINTVGRVFKPKTGD